VIFRRALITNPSAAEAAPEMMLQWEMKFWTVRCTIGMEDHESILFRTIFTPLEECTSRIILSADRINPSSDRVRGDILCRGHCHFRKGSAKIRRDGHLARGKTICLDAAPTVNSGP
jgi:hypothetical protein